MEIALVYAAVGVVTVVLALLSRRVRGWPVSEPLIGLLLGVILGRLGVLGGAGETGWDDSQRDLLLLESSRLLLAASVMAAALRFPTPRLREVWRPVVWLLLVVMPAAAAISGALALAVGLPLALAAVVGACLSPTDPVLAASVVSGDVAERTLPGRLRTALTAESGANDGLALPLVAITVSLALPGRDTGHELVRVAWEVGGAVAIGAALGLATAAGRRAATRRHDLADGPALVLTLLLALFVLGVARVAQTDGILAVFVAGIAYGARTDAATRERQDTVDEAVNRYAVVPFFAIVGAALPWADIAALGWGGVVLVVGALLVRRLPVVLALAPALGLSRRDAVFAGWFGPMGVSAVFYLAHARDEGVTDPQVFAAGVLVVVASTVVHGVTAAPGARLYARRAAA
ncbi:cation:proton antiporter domain-containing protein [Cellulosimicrobium marinum]|uniref:cation:proton antiporter domain-containing protein n=1 Tax=Cellulosimicrobium marinum TaxID=1638992 RepID=UPI001E454BF8|nr:cation:proton antiporter [Cellulosimicrobium marinum]MCB7135653.1 cation:proton antiporter [Cellulosimicrobium marinum]